MKTTLSVIKADIGSIGGHIAPSVEVFEAVNNHVAANGKSIISDFFINHTGDDIAILMAHSHGVENKVVHTLAWDAFVAGVNVAKEQGLYGAGQDLFKQSFSGNIKGMGPAVAEMEFEQRMSEPFLFFTADKTEAGAYNLPLYMSFADPMHSPGLMLSSSIGKGFTYVIVDEICAEGERTIELNAPEQLYEIATLLRDTGRFVIKSIWSRDTEEQAAVVSTLSKSIVGGRCRGKDDPVLLVRVQSQFPSSGEVVAPYSLNHYVAGGSRGSHNIPLMPCRQDEIISYFDGPIVSCVAFCVHNGKFTSAVDLFDNPFWDEVRNNVIQKTHDIRSQGFFGPAMLPYKDLEYTGISKRMKTLEERFKMKK